MILCDWNPKYSVVSGVTSDGACKNPAEISIGRYGIYHLCESCAKLPKFKRFKVRHSLKIRAQGMIGSIKGPYLVRKKRAVREWEIKTITKVLEQNNWVVTFAAQDMGMDRPNLLRKIRSLGIKRLKEK